MAVGRLYKSEMLIRGEGPAASTPFLRLPIDSLTTEAEPFVGSGSTTLELFDGRMVYRPPVYRYRIVLNWDELTAKEANVLYRLIQHLTGTDVDADLTGTFTDATIETVNGATDGTTWLYFDRADVSKAIQVVPVLSPDTVRLAYNKRARQRPASIEFVSTNPTDTVPKQWLIES